MECDAQQYVPLPKLHCDIKFKKYYGWEGGSGGKYLAQGEGRWAQGSGRWTQGRGRQGEGVTGRGGDGEMGRVEK